MIPARRVAVLTAAAAGLLIVAAAAAWWAWLTGPQALTVALLAAGAMIGALVTSCTPPTVEARRVVGSAVLGLVVAAITIMAVIGLIVRDSSALVEAAPLSGLLLPMSATATWLLAARSSGRHRTETTPEGGARPLVADLDRDDQEAA